MSDLWYRELGFKENPFSIKPAALHDEVVAYDLEEIYDKVEYGDVLFVEGPFGMGKSTILKNVINEFGGDRKIIYYSANRDNKADFKNLIRESRGVLGRMFNARPRELVLLVDEADHLTEQDFQELEELYEKGVVKSLIFVAPNFEEVKINDYFSDLVKDNVISLTELEDEEAVGLVRSRIGDTDYISDDIIKKIYSHSGKNPRQLLKNVEEVCRYAFEFGDEKVLEEHLEEVFGKNKK